MKPHPTPHRIRKTIKWGGAAVTVLLLVVWIGSGWFIASWMTPWGFRTCAWQGRLELMIDQSTKMPIPSHFADVRAMPGSFYWRPHWVRMPTFLLVTVPLWMFAGVSGLATVLAWRLDRAARLALRPNICPKCNYDRAGIAKDAKCPECGRLPS